MYVRPPVGRYLATVLLYRASTYYLDSLSKKSTSISFVRKSLLFFQRYLTLSAHRATLMFLGCNLACPAPSSGYPEQRGRSNHSTLRIRCLSICLLCYCKCFGVTPLAICCSFNRAWVSHSSSVTSSWDCSGYTMVLEPAWGSVLPLGETAKWCWKVVEKLWLAGITCRDIHK